VLTLSWSQRAEVDGDFSPFSLWEKGWG
jgi:hypothetical protein